MSRRALNDTSTHSPTHTHAHTQYTHTQAPARANTHTRRHTSCAYPAAPHLAGVTVVIAGWGLQQGHHLCQCCNAACLQGCNAPGTCHCCVQARANHHAHLHRLHITNVPYKGHLCRETRAVPAGGYTRNITGTKKQRRKPAQYHTHHEADQHILFHMCASARPQGDKPIVTAF